MHNYETVYYVEMNRSVDGDKNRNSLRLQIKLAYKLMEFADGHQLSTKPQTLLINQEDWKHIALVAVDKRNLTELMEGGAFVWSLNLCYSNIVDAKLQMIYMASRHLVEPEDIQECTYGQITKNQYIALVKHFYDEYPEKFI